MSLHDMVELWVSLVAAPGLLQFTVDNMHKISYDPLMGTTKEHQ